MTHRTQAPGALALAVLVASALFPRAAAASKADAFEGKIQPVSGQLYRKAGRLELTAGGDLSLNDAFFQKRVPKGAPDYVETARIEFPSGRHADEICPTEVAVVAWAGQMGTITFHPWPVRREDVDHPDELRLDLDPQPGTDFGRCMAVVSKNKDAVRVFAPDPQQIGDAVHKDARLARTSAGQSRAKLRRVRPGPELRPVGR